MCRVSLGNIDQLNVDAERTAAVHSFNAMVANPLIRQGLSHDNMSDKRDCRNVESVAYRWSMSQMLKHHKDILRYLTQYSITARKIRNALKPLISLMFVNYRHYKEILVSLCPPD